LGAAAGWDTLLSLRIHIERAYFTEEESKYTSDIARLRIHIERAFARVKQFQVFAKTLKITQSDLVGKMFKVACYLTHYMPPLVSDKEDESEP